MAVDSAGRLFVEVGPMIYIFDVNGNVLARFTSPAVGPGDFFSGLLLDGSGSGYVAEARADQVEKFQLLAPFTPAP